MLRTRCDRSLATQWRCSSNPYRASVCGKELTLIQYTTSADGLTCDQLQGFFVGWPNPPSLQTHLRVLRASAVVALALNTATGRVVGFATALTDGALSAYVPLLEVLPEYRGQGIGTALVRNLLDQLGALYMVDMTCDREVQPFYARLGFAPTVGMGLRRYDRQSGRG
jgi:ribosomal protein S18 acetylase RimI-like enzyme